MCSAAPLKLWGGCGGCHLLLLSWLAFIHYFVNSHNCEMAGVYLCSYFIYENTGLVFFLDRVFSCLCYSNVVGWLYDMVTSHGERLGSLALSGSPHYSC